MKPELIEKLIHKSLNFAIDFSEVFYERQETVTLKRIDRRMDFVHTKITKGVGIRIAQGTKTAYAATNDLKEESLFAVINQLASPFSGPPLQSRKPLIKPIIPEKKRKNFQKEQAELLKHLDQLVRAVDPRVIQFEGLIQEFHQDVIIANHTGKCIGDRRERIRLTLSVTVEQQGRKESHFDNVGITGNFDRLNLASLDDLALKITQIALEKLTAVDCQGGEMPVVLGNGFGGVIFHEACGHALEATSVARHVSVLDGKVGQQIAGPKVTLIDDGSVEGAWGTTRFDDEGTPTQKNILIENGILKGYLIDTINGREMNMPITGSARRQNYTVAPTSRMNNTYLQAGTDSFEEMIQSIDNGLYIPEMTGGEVHPATGDFNFSASLAYQIKDGKIAAVVKGVSLIGNTLEILNRVSMVGDNLSLMSGWCGSESGVIPVTIGQPAIKVSKILVGGSKQ